MSEAIRPEARSSKYTPRVPHPVVSSVPTEGRSGYLARWPSISFCIK